MSPVGTQLFLSCPRLYPAAHLHTARFSCISQKWEQSPLLTKHCFANSKNRQKNTKPSEWISFCVLFLISFDNNQLSQWGHLSKKKVKILVWVIHILSATLTNLAVLSTEVYFAPAGVWINSIFALTPILTGFWLTLVSIYTQVQNTHINTHTHRFLGLFLLEMIRTRLSLILPM